MRKNFLVLTFLLMLVVMIWLAQLDIRAAAPFVTESPEAFSGWTTVDRNEGQVILDGPALRIFIKNPNYYLWSIPEGEQYRDVSMEVDASRTAGPDKNDFGFLCRYRDPNNFYYLVASTAGFYKIGKVVGGAESPVGMPDYSFDDRNLHLQADNSGVINNHMRADCIGSSLSLYANGVLLAQVEDTDLADGNIGLMAGSWETGGVEMRFTHFKVH